LKVAQFYMQHKPSSAKRYISQVLKINPNHRQGLELMIAYQKKYMLIAHDAPFQRRLDKLDALNKVTPAVLASHVSVVAEKVIEPGLERLPEQMVDDHAPQLEPEVIALVDMQFAAEKSSDVSIFQHYLKQAKRGGADDQYMLGLMYHEGRGVVQNDKQGVRLIKQAAVQGLAKAQCTLGMMLYEAIGGNKKEKEAMQWLMRAAKQGVVDAQYALGLIYTTHHRFKDHGKAVKWWKVAAAQQDTRAQHNLAVMYFKGQGVAKSKIKAQYWLQQEAKQTEKFGGNQTAKETAEHVGKHSEPGAKVNLDRLYSEIEQPQR